MAKPRKKTAETNESNDSNNSGNGGQEGARRSVTAAARYQALAAGRSSYLERARNGAKLTVPSLLPPEGSGKGTDTKIETPFQGIGAEGVSTLAARILLTLFPPNMPMFRMTINDLALQQAHEAAQTQAAQSQPMQPISLLKNSAK